jgi:hypothetical protein
MAGEGRFGRYNEHNFLAPLANLTGSTKVAFELDSKFFGELPLGGGFRFFVGGQLALGD